MGERKTRAKFVRSEKGSLENGGGIGRVFPQEVVVRHLFPRPRDPCSEWPAGREKGRGGALENPEQNRKLAPIFFSSKLSPPPKKNSLVCEKIFASKGINPGGGFWFSNLTHCR